MCGGLQVIGMVPMAVGGIAVKLGNIAVDFV